METMSGYIRLSHEAGDTNVSLEGMVRDVVKLAEQHGYALAPHPGPDCPPSCQGQPVHVDDGVSGAVRNRPAFLAWLADGRSGDVDALGAWHTDRITREGINAAAMLLDVVEGKDTVTGRVVRRPVRYLGFDDKADSRHGDAFRLKMAIDAEIGRAERARAAARNRAKDARLRAAGRWAGGPPPYGYRVVPHPGGKGKALALDTKEAAAVQQAASMVLAEDDSSTLGEVTRWLTAHAPARRAKGWTRSTVKQMLTSYGLTGAAMARPRNADGSRVSGTRTTEPVMTETGQVFRPWPEVLSPAVVEELRRVLDGKQGRPTKPAGGRAPAHLLTGLLTCSGCEGPMVIHYARPAKRQDSAGYVSYFCQSWQKTSECARRVGISAQRAEAYVTGLYLGKFGDSPMMAPVVTVSGGGEVERIESEIADVMRAMAKSATPELLAKLQTLQADRAAAGDAPVERRTEWKPTGRTFAQEWEARNDVLWRRSVLDEAFESLRVLPGRRPVHERIEVTWSRRQEDYEALADIAEQERTL